MSKEKESRVFGEPIDAQEGRVVILSDDEQTGPKSVEGVLDLINLGREIGLDSENPRPTLKVADLENEELLFVAAPKVLLNKYKQIQAKVKDDAICFVRIDYKGLEKSKDGLRKYHNYEVRLGSPCTDSERAAAIGLLGGEILGS